MTAALSLAWAASGVCLIAAVRDIGWRVIDNSLVLLLLLLWAAFVLSRGMGRADVLSHLAVGGGAFAVMAAIYALGWIGGGDVKLAAPVFVWAGPDNAMAVLLVVSVSGVFLGLCCLAARGLRRLSLPKSVARLLAPASAEFGVPYGVALSLGGGLAILAAVAEG